MSPRTFWNTVSVPCDSRQQQDSYRMSPTVSPCLSEVESTESADGITIPSADIAQTATQHKHSLKHSCKSVLTRCDQADQKPRLGRSQWGNQRSGEGRSSWREAGASSPGVSLGKAGAQGWVSELQRSVRATWG